MLQLTKEEEEMLNGKRGEGIARAMEVIVKVAESLDAPRLQPIRHAHVSGVSYGTIGEAGASFLEEIASLGARVSVPASVNPIGYDPESPNGKGILKIDRKFMEGQRRILKALGRMGFTLTLTCTPYYTDFLYSLNLSQGDSVAWGESSAVAYANTVLGLKTNREGGPLALMAAITGRTYYSGLHVDENRIPDTEYVYNEPVDEAVLGVISEYLAEKHESERPPLVRTRRRPREYEVREFAAALGAAGSIAMAVLPGITPLPRRPSISHRDEIDHAWVKSRLSDLKPTVRPDVIFIGCPHTSYEELAIINKEIQDKVKVPVLITLSRDVYIKAKETGLIESLESKGVTFLRGTCLIISKTRELAVATNSYKAYFYLSKKSNIKEVGLQPLPLLMRMARGEEL
ncbi:MAG: aconitase X catalytic domain-containing protein [Desulfurococcales archaeon]|nr:aconitase X catalytic domain-containing protein [Desulfurococcales archaeon]